MRKLAISILGADFMDLRSTLELCESLGDRLHFDVMDGHFVPNLSFGFPVLASLKTRLPIDAHLMIANPEQYAAQYAAYCDTVYIHAETGLDIWLDCANQVRSLGKNCGIVVNPQTAVEDILPLLDQLTHILIMSVEPGFGGQECQTSVFEKIRTLKQQKPSLVLSVDGGINAKTAPLARDAGADVLISGSFILKAKDPAHAANLVRGVSVS